MTGSGKTGLLIGILEDLTRNNIPQIIVDIKGDLPNLAFQTDPTVREKLGIRYLTPGSDHGESVDIIASLKNPNTISSSVTAILKLVGEKRVDPLQSKSHAYLSSILQFKHSKKHDCSLQEIIASVQDPPFAKIGAMQVDELMPVRSRTMLAGKLNNVLVAPSFEYWRTGIALDFDELLKVKDGITPSVIYSVAHLTDNDERIFALSFLFDEIVSWMRSKTGSENLECVLTVDECFGLIPPLGKPATKDPLLYMLKQGRSQGLGVILSTQNPMDIDYKAMANCDTWLIGTLQTANDRKRVVDALAVAGSRYDKRGLEGLIGALKPREFILKTGTAAHKFATRNVGAKLSGPVSVYNIADMYAQRLLTRPSERQNLVGKIISLFQ